MIVKISKGGGHVAALHILAGVGVLAVPLAATNMWLSSQTCLSVHESDHHKIVEELVASGWEPIPDEDDDMTSAGTLEDGRATVLLRTVRPDDDVDDVRVLAALMECMQAV